MKLIPYLNGNNLKGIFSYLREQSTINEEVSISQSSFSGGDSNLLLDIENTSNDYYTKDQPNSWICFEFIKHRIIPTNYSIRSYNGNHNPKSWVIEVSNDGEKWTKIDEQTNCQYLKVCQVAHTFNITSNKSTDSSGGIKFIRIRQTDKNLYGDNLLNFCSIEFYGKLI